MSMQGHSLIIVVAPASMWQCPDKILGIICVKNPVLPSPTCCDLPAFLCQFRVYSVDSSKMIGKCSESLDFKGLLSQTPPGHVSLEYLYTFECNSEGHFTHKYEGP